METATGQGVALAQNLEQYCCELWYWDIAQLRCKPYSLPWLSQFVLAASSSVWWTCSLGLLISTAQHYNHCHVLSWERPYFLGLCFQVVYTDLYLYGWGEAFCEASDRFARTNISLCTAHRGMPSTSDTLWGCSNPKDQTMWFSQCKFWPTRTLEWLLWLGAS